MGTYQGLSSQTVADIRNLWDFHVVDSGPVAADLLLVLGSHDMRVADRGANLYLSEKAAPIVIVTGGAGKVTSNEWVRSEAELYAERLQELGVPGDAILTESEAANTGDNFEYSRNLILELGASPKTGIIVSKPYMARRSLAVADKKWRELSWYTRPPLIALEDYPTEEVPFNRMVNLMVGDLQRLKVYAEKGFQAHVDIPVTVWAAYERLADVGFNQFVIPDE
jgi:uncharacterized SAM-binding protein YcdF (DUF218 family)